MAAQNFRRIAFAARVSSFLQVCRRFLAIRRRLSSFLTSNHAKNANSGLEAGFVNSKNAEFGRSAPDFYVSKSLYFRPIVILKPNWPHAALILNTVCPMNSVLLSTPAGSPFEAEVRSC